MRGRNLLNASRPGAASGQGADGPVGSSAALPDSGRAWLIAAAGLAANAACWGTMNSFGAFLDSMKTEFDASLGATALIYALPSLVLFVLGMVTGPLAEQYGPRRMVAAGAALMGTGLFITAHSSTLAIAVLAYGLGVGLGMACFLVPITACIGGWFVRRRAVAQGLSAAGSGVGTLAMVPLARWLIDGYGWRRAYEVLAVICVAALLLAAAVADRPPNQRPVGRPSLSRLRQAAAHGPFLQAYAGGFLLSASLFVPFVFLVRYATDHGIAKRDAALLLSILGASNIVSRLATTGLVGRIGAVRLYLLCFMSLPIGLGLWLAAGDSYLLLGVFAAVLGISHGGYVALSPEVTAELFGVENIGTVLGALWTSSGVGGFLSPVLAGMLIDASGYGTTIAVALAVGVLAVVVQPALWAVGRPGGQRAGAAAA
ncbi:MAG: MFS transporter [Acidimicrobiales bacterium]|nr:MFS transporter [Acidimicrobiales bacterium]